MHWLRDPLLIENKYMIFKSEWLFLWEIFLHLFGKKKCATKTTLSVIKIKKHVLIKIVDLWDQYIFMNPKCKRI